MRWCRLAHVARPCGALEITPEGTRFIAFGDERRIRGALARGGGGGVNGARRVGTISLETSIFITTTGRHCDCTSQKTLNSWIFG
jgi:hypothetical protein